MIQYPIPESMSCRCTDWYLDRYETDLQIMGFRGTSSVADFSGWRWVRWFNGGLMGFNGIYKLYRLEIKQFAVENHHVKDFVLKKQATFGKKTIFPSIVHWKKKLSSIPSTTLFFCKKKLRALIIFFPSIPHHSTFEKKSCLGDVVRNRSAGSRKQLSRKFQRWAKISAVGAENSNDYGLQGTYHHMCNMYVYIYIHYIICIIYIHIYI